MDRISGKVLLLGDNIDTDQILPGYAMAEPKESLGKFAMAGFTEFDFQKVFEPGSIIVAGHNFGCGSSREQAPIALKQRGVSLVIAKSFARIFRRNAINIGFPVWNADIEGIVKTGDEISVDLQRGEIAVGDFTYSFAPLSETAVKTLEYGGLIPRVRAELQIK